MVLSVRCGYQLIDVMLFDSRIVCISDCKQRKDFFGTERYLVGSRPIRHFENKIHDQRESEIHHDISAIIDAYLEKVDQ